MDVIEKYFKNDNYANNLGVELVDVREGYAKVSMVVGDQHLNGVKILHGGVIFSLADVAFSIASNSYGTIAVAINANISFIKAFSKGRLFAEAIEQSKNSKLANYEIKVTDEQMNLIAIFNGMVYRKKDKLLS